MPFASPPAAAERAGPALLSFDVRSLGRTTITAPVGELDLATAPALEAELVRQAHAGHAELVLDLRGLTFMDSCGVSLLTRWTQRGHQVGPRLSVIAGPAPVQRILELTSVHELLHFVDAADLGGAR